MFIIDAGWWQRLGVQHLRRNRAIGPSRFATRAQRVRPPQCGLQALLSQGLLLDRDSYGSRDHLIDDRRALRLAVYGYRYLSRCQYRYRKPLGNRGRDGLSRACPKTRARGSRASMIPEPIAPYNSGLV